ncbi:high frequency lysogenization protein HflD [Thalassotalea agarivorans]|uniref:High frequency lysogenization protein HflD homolog n=1 Tax=Thalassotalea agarivorans TaxID=349064 RepID=A0A1I0DB23_THASX|nr:high frequency lysogenization protein HflD [Thalassotalea agarivorans]SET29303.1 high frequency lysogenization protein [Thalassotalea agarivorans]
MKLQHQVFTFAAICQSAKLVQQVARVGTIDQPSLELMLKSIMETSPENPLAVYGSDMHNLTLGLQVVIEQLGTESKSKETEIARYIMSLIALERKLNKNPKALATLGERIAQCERQLAHFDITDETLVASLASIYSDVISPLSAPIQVLGNPELLKQPSNQYKIRALLLAGLRAAVLWRQLGGKRRNILFSRAKMVACAEELLTN